MEIRPLAPFHQVAVIRADRRSGTRCCHRSRCPVPALGVAQRASEILRVLVPGAAEGDPLPAGIRPGQVTLCIEGRDSVRGVPVAGPLSGVAVQVEQAQGVGRARAHRPGAVFAAAIGLGTCGAQGLAVVEDGLAAIDGLPPGIGRNAPRACAFSHSASQGRRPPRQVQ